MTNPNLPPVVYVPTGTHTSTEPGTASSDIELRRTGDGKMALLVYSALDRLVACCGEHQPWVLVSTDDLPAVHQAMPYDVILLDAEIPVELRHQPV